jgi:pimeloyl-ACP methyl ester carboxylesterase
MTTIRPFSPPPFDPADLLRRLQASRWPDDVAGNWSQGTAQASLRDVVKHWQDEYDWDAAKHRLQSLPHFEADIDGVRLHLLHYKSGVPGAIPLLLLNGWPSSFHEYSRIAPLLTSEDKGIAFDLVIPAMPGFGYSSVPGVVGRMNPIDLFHRLMTEALGHERYLVSGTDLGAGTATRMALAHPDSILGIHISSVVDPALDANAPPLTEPELAYRAAVQRWREKEGGYQHQQSTRPQTLAYALNDSPMGLASWLLEKFYSWSDPAAGVLDKAGLDWLIDTLNLYWQTQTIASSMRYYYEIANLRAPIKVGDFVGVPAAVSMWPYDLVRAPREWAARFYQVRQYEAHAAGGHFPAWEQPALYAKTLRDFVGGLGNA